VNRGVIDPDICNRSAPAPDCSYGTIEKNLTQEIFFSANMMGKPTVGL
jgi:hypothetical protein